MATLNEKIRCERDAREFVKEYGLPEPDHVEYGHTCIRLFWEEPKTVLVIDIDDPDTLGDDAAADEQAARDAADDEEEELEDDLD
jgi:hypothetical protein